MSILLEKLFEVERWNTLMDKANEKRINLATLNQLCLPINRVRLYQAIRDGKYEPSPPRCSRIPKDKPGEFREVKINENVDRCVLTLMNDVLFETCPEMVHKNCTSYKKNICSQKTVQILSYHIATKKTIKNGTCYKSDLSAYFDSLLRKWIDWAFDQVEDKFGVPRGSDPFINVLRKCFHSDLLFNVDGDLEERYTALKQGNAVGSWLADVILYKIDEEMTQKCEEYIRYSDDMIFFSKDETILEQLRESLSEYGLELNPKKVEELDEEHFFTFLGFMIKGEQITLSKNRVKRFVKEVTKRSILNPKITAEQAKRNILKYLYEGEFCWATSCLGTITCQTDLDALNCYIMDCIRLCQIRDQKRLQGKKVSKYSMADIGGLGVVTDQSDRTIIRGKGNKIRTARNCTDKIIPQYITVKTLANAMKINKNIYEACVRQIL